MRSSNKFIIKVDGETKPPGVVARLMGLDSLPTTKNPPPEEGVGKKRRSEKRRVHRQRAAAATEGRSSISLALQAKANVLEREKRQQSIDNTNEKKKSSSRRSCSPSSSSSSVLRQNNQKQNFDRKLPKLNYTPDDDGREKRKKNDKEDKENETDADDVSRRRAVENCNVFLFDSRTTNGKGFAESKRPDRRSSAAAASSRTSECKRTKGNRTDDDKRSSTEPNMTPKCQVETTTGKQELSRFADTMSIRCNSIDTSASSTATAPESRKPDVTTQYLRSSGNRKNSWEVKEYVKEVLCDVETMFKDYAFGRTAEVINPPLFYQIECRRLCSNSSSKGLVPRIIRRLWFDCISECTAIRCRHYVGEGWESWARGLGTVHRKDKLAEDICREISGFNDMGGRMMVDEIVGRDMSSKHGTWRNYEIEGFEVGIQIESCILNSMVNEIVADVIKT